MKDAHRTGLGYTAGSRRRPRPGPLRRSVSPSTPPTPPPIQGLIAILTCCLTMPTQTKFPARVASPARPPSISRHIRITCHPTMDSPTYLTLHGVRSRVRILVAVDFKVCQRPRRKRAGTPAADSPSQWPLSSLQRLGSALLNFGSFPGDGLSEYDEFPHGPPCCFQQPRSDLERVAEQAVLCHCDLHDRIGRRRLRPRGECGKKETAAATLTTTRQETRFRPCLAKTRGQLCAIATTCGDGQTAARRIPGPTSDTCGRR